MLAFKSTVSCVTLIKLVNLRVPHFPFLKHLHQEKPAQTSPQGMEILKLWKKNHLYKDKKSPVPGQKSDEKTKRTAWFLLFCTGTKFWDIQDTISHPSIFISFW